MTHQTLEAWQEEMKQKFPKGSESVVFQCPQCKRNTSIKEFKEHGIEEDLAPVNCIGRHVKGLGCDWCAYGLLKTMGYGREILLPSGKTIEVFEFGE